MGCFTRRSIGTLYCIYSSPSNFENCILILSFYFIFCILNPCIYRNSFQYNASCPLETFARTFFLYLLLSNKRKLKYCFWVKFQSQVSTRNVFLSFLNKIYSNFFPVVIHKCQWGNCYTFDNSIKLFLFIFLSS